MPAADVFLFGATSMLGWSILQAAPGPVAAFCNGQTRRAPAAVERGIDMDDPVAMSALFAAERPRLIVHCAGVCDVEMCEQSPDFAYSVNVDGTQLLLDHAPASARIVYCSSDHVFSGDGGPYDEASATDPVSVYGKTRVAAERLIAARPNSLIIRSGLWIGPSASGRNGHLDWLRYRHGKQLPMTVVADELRSAVWAADAARRVWELARSDVTGVRHLVATRVVSRPQLAAYLAKRFAIGARWAVQYRRDRRAPHLGRVELATLHADALAAPLPSVIPDGEPLAPVA